jgi:uncharacterized Ntn-hydrolase superfamily protein
VNHSIIARCAHTGRIGIAMASERLAGGIALEAAIRRGVGGILAQGTPNPRLNRLATNLLTQGWAPAVVLKHLQAADAELASRQVAIVDREMLVAVSSPPASAQHVSREGTGFAVLASGSGCAAVADAMADSFRGDPAADLDDRLLAALEAGDRVAQGGARRSAAIVMWGIRDYSELDLRVDLHPQPVRELRRVFDDFKPTAEFYEARARNPRMTMNAREFAGMLEQRRGKQA